MPKACPDFRNYSFYVNPEDGHWHNAAHLHVKWPDDSSVLLLPTLMVLAGDPLPRDVREYIAANLEEIVRNWNLYNPLREVEQ